MVVTNALFGGWLGRVQIRKYTSPDAALTLFANGNVHPCKPGRAAAGGEICGSPWNRRAKQSTVLWRGFGILTGTRILRSSCGASTIGNGSKRHVQAGDGRPQIRENKIAVVLLVGFNVILLT